MLSTFSALTHSFTHSLTYSLTTHTRLTHSFTHSLIHSFTHSLTHSRTHTLTYTLSIHSLDWMTIEGWLSVSGFFGVWMVWLVNSLESVSASLAVWSHEALLLMIKILYNHLKPHHSTLICIVPKLVMWVVVFTLDKKSNLKVEIWTSLSYRLWSFGLKQEIESYCIERHDQTIRTFTSKNFQLVSIVINGYPLEGRWHHWKKVLSPENPKIPFIYVQACLSSRSTLRSRLEKNLIWTQLISIVSMNIQCSADGTIGKNFVPLKPKDTLYLPSGMLIFASYTKILMWNNFSFGFNCPQLSQLLTIAINCEAVWQSIKNLFPRKLKDTLYLHWATLIFTSYVEILAWKKNSFGLNWSQLSQWISSVLQMAPLEKILSP